MEQEERRPGTRFGDGEVSTLDRHRNGPSLDHHHDLSVSSAGSSGMRGAPVGTVVPRPSTEASSCSRYPLRPPPARRTAPTHRRSSPGTACSAASPTSSPRRRPPLDQVMLLVVADPIRRRAVASSLVNFADRGQTDGAASLAAPSPRPMALAVGRSAASVRVQLVGIDAPKDTAELAASDELVLRPTSDRPCLRRSRRTGLATPPGRTTPAPVYSTLIARRPVSLESDWIAPRRLVRSWDAITSSDVLLENDNNIVRLIGEVAGLGPPFSKRYSDTPSVPDTETP
jgi:hypothetical protein